MRLNRGRTSGENMAVQLLMDGDRAACLDAGTNAYLAKPATIEALAVSLDEC